MAKKRNVKEVDHLALAEKLYFLMISMYQFRVKYNLSEATFWDVVHIYWYYMKYSKGCSIRSLQIQRYRKATGYRAMRERLDLLIDRGLLHQEKRKMYPAEQLLKDLISLTSSEAALALMPGLAA